MGRSESRTPDLADGGPTGAENAKVVASGITAVGGEPDLGD